MNLLHPLTLEQASTENVNLVPTKKFFKPVLVLVVPIDKDSAEKIQAGYLFDAHGNPHVFEGTHKLPGELSGAEVCFCGKQTPPATLRSEKVAHFGCFIQEEALQLRLRIHFPEGKDEGLDELFELLRFLKTLNKDPFDITIIPQQGGLPGVGDDDGKYPVADESGLYSEKRAVIRKFAFKVGRRDLAGQVMTLETETGFIGGWRCNAAAIAKASKDDNVAGKSLTTDLVTYASENEALEHAVRELYDFAVNILSKAISGPKEKEAYELMVDWCVSQVPTLTAPRG